MKKMNGFWKKYFDFMFLGTTKCSYCKEHSHVVWDGFWKYICFSCFKERGEQK